MEHHLISLIYRQLLIRAAYFISSLSRQRPSELLNQQSPVPFLHCKVLILNVSLPLTKLDQQGCPRSSFSARLAPCPLLLPHCSWGSHSLATASPVPQARYPRRAPASPSGALLSLRAQPLPTIPPQVCLFLLVCSKS